jgi:hypothetical protein
MRAGEASLWFSQAALDGWNGTAWVSNVCYGDFHAYDRFITERTFGAKKRMFLAHQDNAFNPATYPVVRTVDQKVWIVVSVNADLDASPYAQSYLLHEAKFTAQAVAITTTTRASGQSGTPTEWMGTATPCDLEQYTLQTSREMDQVVYGVFKVVLPGNFALSDDQELSISGARYDVKEVWPELLTKVARVAKRGVTGV